MKMHSILNPPGFVAAVALALCGAGPALAQTVDWGSSRSYVPISFTSDGQVDNGGPGTQTLIWTLGWFTDGFVPTATNYENWGANYNQIPGTSTQRILPVDWYTTEYHTDDVGAAAAGKQMYIFAYNSLSLIGQETGEALLFRQNGLLFPSILNAVTFDIDDDPSTTADNSFDVIWGRVDREMYNSGGILTGGGLFSTLMPDSTGGGPSGTGTFEAQSGHWAAVPESSSALLGLMGCTLLLNRRRR